MTRNRKKNQKWYSSHQRRFEPSDFEWLIDQFNKEIRLNPDLTMEEFAIGYGIQPELINRFMIAKRIQWQPANEHRSGRKRRTSDLMHFESADFACLAKHFQRQAELTPDLTLEAFAIRHGIQPSWISHFIATDENTLSLRHGTTEDRARSIMEQGFRGPRKSNQVWFSKSSKFACGIANGRAEARHRMPVVISCEIDVKKYSTFQSSNFQTYVFPAAIDKEVICSVSIVKGNWVFSIPEAKITRTSGKPELLSWINWYLKMGNEASITEEHPIVEAIFKWVRAQYAQDREKSICDEEMFSMMTLIRSISGLEMGDQPPQADEKDELVDVVITQNAGKLGVLYWINRYLALTGEEPVSEEHPTVDAISRWVEAEYTRGRDEPISDEEMLMQVMTNLGIGE